MAVFHGKYAKVYTQPVYKPPQTQALFKLQWLISFMDRGRE